MIKLPGETIKLIGSNQVITSVSSAVKELVENALDAETTSVDVKLENFGLDKIEIVDNGSGIKTSEVAFMAQQHYTSKISDFSDLESTESYGFRGEALSSLCSVSDVTVISKTSFDASAMMYKMNHNGLVIETRPIAGNQGTTITAVNMFKTLPVRKQFYSSGKRKKDELKNVEDMLMSFSLIKPNVRFSLRHNKDVMWQRAACDDVKACVMSVFGLAAAGVLHHVHHQLHLSPTQFVTIDGFLPDPSHTDWTPVTRSNPDRFFIYINSRPVQCKEIYKLLRQHILRDSNRHIMGYLHLQLPVHYTDINIEPNKTRVLLTDKDAVLSGMEEMLSSVYSTADTCQQGKPADDGTNTMTANVDTSEPNTLRVTSTPPATTPVTCVIGVTDVTGMNNATDVTNVTDVTTTTTTTTANVMSGGGREWSMGTAVVDASNQPVQPVDVLLPGVTSCHMDHVTVTDQEQSSSLKSDSDAHPSPMASVTWPIQSQTPSSNVLTQNSQKLERRKQSATSLNQKRKRSEVSDDERTPKIKDVFERVGKSTHHRRASFVDVNGNSNDDDVVIYDVNRRDTVHHAFHMDFISERRRVCDITSTLEDITSTPEDITSTPHDSSLHIVCKLPNREEMSDCWLVRDHNSLFTVNTWRCKEVVIYINMLHQYRLPTEAMSIPLDVTPRSLGSEHLFNTLLGLSYSRTKRESTLDPYSYFIDDHLILNGMELRFRSEGSSGNIKVEMYRVTTGIDNFGVEDLKEILQMIHNAQTTAGVEVPKCVRPRRVRQYIREVARKVSEDSAVATTDTVELQDMLEKLKDSTNETCPHGKQWCSVLYRDYPSLQKGIDILY